MDLRYIVDVESTGVERLETRNEGGGNNDNALDLV